MGRSQNRIMPYTNQIITVKSHVMSLQAQCCCITVLSKHNGNNKKN